MRAVDLRERIGRMKRERAVRLVLEHEGEHAALGSEKIGSTSSVVGFATRAPVKPSPIEIP